MVEALNISDNRIVDKISHFNRLIEDNDNVFVGGAKFIDWCKTYLHLALDEANALYCGGSVVPQTNSMSGSICDFYTNISKTIPNGIYDKITAEVHEAIETAKYSISTENCGLKEGLRFVSHPLEVFFNKPIGVIWAVIPEELEQAGNECVRSCANFISLMSSATKSQNAINVLGKEIWIHEKTTEDSAKGIAEACKEALGCRAIVIWQTNSSRKLPMLDTLVVHGNCGSGITLDVPVSYKSIPGTCAKDGKMISVDDFSNVEFLKSIGVKGDRLLELVKGMGWLSGVFVPLDVGGSIQGVISAFAERRHAFSEIDKNIVQAFAQRLIAGYTHISRMNELERMERGLRREAPYIETGILAMENTHDAFNCLGMSQAYLSNIKDEFKRYPESKVYQWCQVAINNTDRSLKILKLLMNGADITKVVLQKRQLLESIKFSVAHLNEDAKTAKINISISCPDKIVFKYDEQQMIRVFKNIIENAIYFLRSIRRQKKTIKISAKHENEKVNIVFYDNGPGIPEEDNLKVFDYLYTTKGKDKGIGFGLAISKRIVEENHKGKIWVESVWGEYTEFHVELPTNKLF